MTSFVFSALKRQWNILQQMAVWVGMVIGMFLMQPPVLTLSGSGGVDPLRYAQFLFAILAAIVFQSFTRRTEQRVQRLRIAAALAVASTILFFSYMATLNSWTCSYAVHWQVVMSSDYTEDAKKHAATLPGQGKSCAEVLQEYGGAAELVWDPAEARPRYLAIQFLYLGLWICSALTLVFALPTRPATSAMQVGTH